MENEREIMEMDNESSHVNDSTHNYPLSIAHYPLINSTYSELPHKVLACR